LLDTIDTSGVDTSRLHTDTTSIRFTGAYPDADGHGRGGKPTPAIVRGHSKDHRPDLKQLVWSSTVSADGAVPICHRVADGNTNDDELHTRLVIAPPAGGGPGVGRGVRLAAQPPDRTRLAACCPPVRRAGSSTRNRADGPGRRVGDPSAWGGDR
jgi:hypothetical protein